MGADVLFRFGSGQDLKNSRVVIAQADQGGLGLPDRAFYFKNDSGEMGEKYLEHVGRMFVLIGEPPEKAAIKAQAVMKIETALAAGSLDIGWRRGPVSLYHKTPLRELVTSIFPSFAWRKYLFESKAPHIETLNLVVPAFFAGLDNLIKNSDLRRLEGIPNTIPLDRDSRSPLPFGRSKLRSLGAVLDHSEIACDAVCSNIERICLAPLPAPAVCALKKASSNSEWFERSSVAP